MLTIDILYEIAKNRFVEAEILLKNNKPDGAVYLSGYAIELMLKRHIVEVLNWDGYPSEKSEFAQLDSFKTHSLEVLLKLSGLEKSIKKDNAVYARWEIVSGWKSEVRYQKIGNLTLAQAQRIIDATRETLNFILRIKV